MTDMRCQSCGMPLGAPGYFGSNEDGSENTEYCKYCYEKGVFTMPDLTVEGAVDASVQYMVKNGFEEAKAREMSQAVIPGLRRWKV
jgi:hypothetical protein